MNFRDLLVALDTIPQHLPDSYYTLTIRVVLSLEAKQEIVFASRITNRIAT